jgi:pyruvate/2-oxoglutarate dehydrogenase complex dihydrolipoamide dehydrogenase (E3) component
MVLVTHKGRLVGAHVLAPAAGEVVHELALAIHQELKLTDLSSVVHVYPTIGLGVQLVAAQASYERARRLSFLVRA